jgi:DNA-binding CsgD family transcriptional regulator
MDDEILDKIYEAGVMPELWPGVLEEFCRIGNVRGGLLFALRDDNITWTASKDFSEFAAGYFERDYATRNQRTARLLARDHSGFVTDTDVFTAEEWEADPIRQEYFVPHGYGWGVGTHITVPTGDLLIFHGERWLTDGPVSADAVARLDQLRPHLARAALMSARLSFEHLVGAMEALDMVGIPAAVVDSRGQAIVTNGLLDELTPHAIQSLPTRLALANSSADALLATAIAALPSRRQDVPQSVPVPAGHRHPPMIVHVHPLRRSARDIFVNAAAVLLVTPVTTSEMPSNEVIRGLFDLTPTEARVARSLGGGATIGGIAAASGASVATVRSQVRSVFAKTGIHRQSELVGLLQGLSPIARQQTEPTRLPSRRGKSHRNAA